MRPIWAGGLDLWVALPLHHLTARDVKVAYELLSFDEQYAVQHSERFPTCEHASGESWHGCSWAGSIGTASYARPRVATGLPAVHCVRRCIGCVATWGPVDGAHVRWSFRNRGLGLPPRGRRFGRHGYGGDEMRGTARWSARPRYRLHGVAIGGVVLIEGVNIRKQLKKQLGIGYDDQCSGCVERERHMQRYHCWCEAAFGRSCVTTCDGVGGVLKPYFSA